LNVGVIFDTFVYLLPFVGMIYDVKNSILNVLLFVPLGMFLSFLCDKYTKLKNTLLLGVLTTLTVEFLQFFTYRKTDINDVITNSAGTVIGFWIATLIIKKLPKAQAKGSVKEILTISAITLCIMFFFQPFVSSLLWNLIR
jgi:glycopeptide antibiotics resistance protein